MNKTWRRFAVEGLMLLGVLVVGSVAAVAAPKTVSASPVTRGPCGDMTDVLENIAWWPDSYWHVGTYTQQFHPDGAGSWENQGSWYVTYPHDSWESGYTASHGHSQC